MPVPILGLKDWSDNQKVKFLTIFGRPKTGIFREFGGVPGRAPLATNHAVNLAAPKRTEPHRTHRIEPPCVIPWPCPCELVALSQIVCYVPRNPQVTPGYPPGPPWGVPRGVLRGIRGYLGVLGGYLWGHTCNLASWHLDKNCTAPLEKNVSYLGGQGGSMGVYPGGTRGGPWGGTPGRYPRGYPRGLLRGYRGVSGGTWGYPGGIHPRSPQPHDSQGNFSWAYRLASCFFGRDWGLRGSWQLGGFFAGFFVNSGVFRAGPR